MRRMPLNSGELEKIKVVEVKNYSLVMNETYQKVSSINEFKDLINILKNIKDYSNQFPLLLANINLDDSESYTYLCVIPYDEQSEFRHVIHYIDTFPSSHVYYTLTYDEEEDTITISVKEKSFLTEDNTKNIFGISIVGTGDINLYRHELFINSATFIIYSPNKLSINSPQDLTSVVKPDNFSIFMGAIYSSDLPPLTVVLYYDNGIWKINDGSVTNVTTIKDHVIPL